MNSLTSEVARREDFRKKGRALSGLAFDRDIEQRVNTWEIAVVNQATPPTETFGYFFDIENERNINEGKLKVRTVANAAGEVVFVSRPDRVNEAALEQLMPHLKKFTKTQQIVAAGTAPDAITFTIIRSAITYIDTVHAEKENWVVDEAASANWHKIVTVGEDGDTQIAVTETREIVEISTTVTPVPGSVISLTTIDEAHKLKVTKAIDTAALEAYLASFPATTNLNIPDQLNSVSVQWAESAGEGSFDSEWNGAAIGQSYSLSGSEDGTAESSKSLIPEITFDIKQFWGQNLPTTMHFFYLPKPVTLAHILNKVSATAWPVFKPESHVISLIGAKVSVQAKANASASLSVRLADPDVEEDITDWSSDLSQGEGDSYDVSNTHNTRVIPPTVHETINFTGVTEKSSFVEATAAAGWIGTGSPISFPTADATITASAEIEASVNPTTLVATTPSSVPVSGVYLVDMKVQPWEYGYVMVMAEVLDASIFA